MSSPWADPSSGTTEGAPYAGPPATEPPGYPTPGPYGYGPPGYGPPGYAAPYGYGPSPYGPFGHPAPGPFWGPPPGPRRPGQLIAAAVLAFVQAAVVSLASLYAFLLAGLVSFAADQGSGGAPSGVPGPVEGLATEATVLAVVQLVSVIALVVGGILALTYRPQLTGGNRRAWLVLVAALAGQLVLTVYWAIRLTVLLGDIPGPDDGAPGVLVGISLLFAAGPAVALGLAVSRTSRRWLLDAGK